MANKFEKFFGDFVRGGGGQLIPGLGFVFDMFGGNDPLRRKLAKQAGRPNPGEAELLSLLRNRANENPNSRVLARNEEILDAAQRQQRENQRAATTQLEGQLADTGLLDSGIAQRLFAQQATTGQQELANLAATLQSEAERERERFEDKRFQALAQAAGLTGQISERGRQTKQNLDAQRLQNQQSFVNNLGGIITMLATGGLGGAGGGIAQLLSSLGQSRQGASAEDILRLLQQIDLDGGSNPGLAGDFNPTSTGIA